MSCIYFYVGQGLDKAIFLPDLNYVYFTELYHKNVIVHFPCDEVGGSWKHDDNDDHDHVHEVRICL
jgi:hypothetical protein